MADIDNGKLLRALVKRFKRMENRIVDLEKQVELMKTKEDATQIKSNAKLKHQLAEHVGSLVGLKEALTWPRHSMKWIWSVLLILGLAATIVELYTTTAEYLASPTATNVELERPPVYPYPYMALCPGEWFDVDKALNRGLTLDAIKYSIGYADQFVFDDNVNVDQARHQFLQFYQSNNYTNLLAYYQDMTLEISRASSSSSFADYENSSYWCSGAGCVDEDRFMEKNFIDSGMCYAFSFDGIDTRHYQGTTQPQISVKIRNLLKGVLRSTPNWRAYLLADKNLSKPNFVPVTLEPFTVTTIKVTAQRFIALNHETHKCLEQDSTPIDYSAERCIINCLNGVFKKQFGCNAYSYAAYDPISFPSQYCNYFENLPHTNQSFANVFDVYETKIIQSEDGAKCVSNCTYACDRVIFDSTMDSKFTVAVSANSILTKAKERNMTLLAIIIDHASISQGGILTLTEVTTFSFSTFVSNVGGTLGLFLGGTIFTFFQLILFCISYALDWRERKRAVNPSRQQNMNGNV